MNEYLKSAIERFDEDDLKDGDMLTHEWMAWALDIPAVTSLEQVKQNQFLVMERVEEFKNYLLTDRKIALETCRGIGYRIVPPNDQARHAAYESMRMVKRGLEKGIKIITNTRTEELSNDERKTHTDAEVRLIGIAGMMKKQRRDVFALINKRD